MYKTKIKPDRKFHPKGNEEVPFNRMPSFSFAHLSHDKDRNFDFFRGEIRKQLEAHNALIKLLIEVSSETLVVLGNRNKFQQGGYEALREKQVACNPYNLTITKDQKIYTFRFGNKDAYRMLCVLERESTVFKIIGFDWGHDAYDHGK